MSELTQLLLLFLRLGVTAFGGPAAHIAMMEEEVVRRRGWLTHQEFIDLLGATNLIPGPNSTELAMHIGHQRAGIPGLLVAGAMFILPAAAITLATAWAYVRFGSLPRVEGALYGVKPVIIAIVVQALVSLAPKAGRTARLAALGAASLALTVLGVHELVVLAAAGIVASALAEGATARSRAVWMVGGVGSAVASAAAPSVFSLFWVFAKIGSVLFGSGYVLLAFLRRDLVEARHWLSEAQLLDAVTAGQITPGPVFTTATFVGYVIAGTPGAVAATVGIFLPAFVFVALSGVWVPKLRRSPKAAAFLDGVNVASLALMAVVAARLGVSAIVDGVTAVVAMASLAVLMRTRVSSVWLIAGGSVLGALLRMR